MRVKIEIDCDGAAFHDDSGELTPEWELTNILGKLSEDLKYSPVESTRIADSNGNYVCTVTIEE